MQFLGVCIVFSRHLIRVELLLLEQVGDVPEAWSQIQDHFNSQAICDKGLKKCSHVITVAGEYYDLSMRPASAILRYLKELDQTKTLFFL